MTDKRSRFEKIADEDEGIGLDDEGNLEIVEPEQREEPPLTVKRDK